MKRKRFSVGQIVGELKQAELGVPVAELVRQVGITVSILPDDLKNASNKHLGFDPH